jgi:hypothetical protein
MGLVDDTARRLLREMGYQAQGNPTPDVVPREAAENLDLDPGAPEYEAALKHLLALGDIKPNADTALAEQGLFRLTRQGSKGLEKYVGDNESSAPSPPWGHRDAALVADYVFGDRDDGVPR